MRRDGPQASATQIAWMEALKEGVDPESQGFSRLVETALIERGWVKNGRLTNAAQNYMRKREKDKNV